MAESDHVAEVKQAPGGDHRLQTLRQAGGDRFDPVRFHFIEALARRTQAHHGDARRILDGRLSAALAAYSQRFEQARSDACETLTRVARQYPQAADPLQQIFAAGDFSEMKRFVARVEQSRRPAALAELTGVLAQRPAEDRGAGLDDEPGARSELKALRYFRQTWSKLSVDKQVTQAIEQGPENAGPLNSHRLVLASLALMRELSPDYLCRFMSYADSLLWLDRVAHRPTAKKTPSASKTGARV